MNSYAIIMIGYKSVDNIINRINEAYSDGSPNEFILIINYYSEESYKILEYAKNEPRITRYIYCSQNIGFAKAINLGANISKSDNLIIANDDCATNSQTHKNLSQVLNEKEENGISCVEIGGKHGDIIPIPKGFLLAIKRSIISKIGGYIYDECASPLGCETELTYRVKTYGYNLILANNCHHQHVHDISNHPQTMINYLGVEMSPQGEKAFQFETEKLLDEKINKWKNIIKNEN